MSGIRWTLEEVTNYQKKRDGKKPEAAASQPRKESLLERRFDQLLIEAGLPEPRKDWFFLNDRNFELDRAWPAQKVAVEIQGGAHRAKGKWQRDIEKRALAMFAGWRVLEVDGSAIKDGRAIEWTKRLLEWQ